MLKVYLDQNILTDLRKRKVDLQGSEWAKILRSLFIQFPNLFKILYSDATLDEIYKIKYPNFQEEYIVLLQELNAIHTRYDPRLNLNQITEGHIRHIWQQYSQQRYLLKDTGIDSLLKPLIAISKILSGQKIEGATIKELILSFIDQYNSLIENLTAAEIKNIDITNSHDSALSDYFSLLLKNTPILSIKDFLNIDLFDSYNLDMSSLQNTPILRLLNIQNADHSEVLNLVKSTLDINMSSDNNHTDPTIAHYSLLNAIGYWADDFKSTKGNRDGFLASFNDASHTSSAKAANFFITNDVNLSNKAKAIYSDLGINTVICNPNEFISMLPKIFPGPPVI